MQINMNLGFEDVLLKPNKSVLSSRSDADISVWFGKTEFSSPVIPANMPSIITPELYEYFIKKDWYAVYHRLGGPSDVFKLAENCAEKNILCSISVGVKQEWTDLITALYYNDIPVHYFTVDVAHSHNDNVLPILTKIRENYPDSFITMGNGCTKEWAEWCDELWANDILDAIKVGIGVSQACRTRQYTGFGSTTLGSLKEVKDAITPHGLQIVSDGGINVDQSIVRMNPIYNDKKEITTYQAIYQKAIHVGDVNKALIFGADMVMSGAIFSNCNDVPAATEGYFGNASARGKGDKWHVEGDVVITDCENKPSVREMIHLVNDSIRSAVSYSGGRNIEEMKSFTKHDIV